jgi:hypothetical protein
MPKGPSADDPISVVTRRIPRPIGSGAHPDLPAGAWARLFAVALSRLQRAKPRWASVTAVEVEDLLASWMVFLQDKTLSRAERDLRLEEALEHLERHPPWGAKRTRRAPRSHRVSPVRRRDS